MAVAVLVPVAVAVAVAVAVPVAVAVAVGVAAGVVAGGVGTGENVAHWNDCGSIGTWRVTWPACAKVNVTGSVLPPAIGFDRLLSTISGVGPVRLTGDAFTARATGPPETVVLAAQPVAETLSSVSAVLPPL